MYARDLADPEYEQLWPGYAVTPERILKLACIFELFHLRDCAAELLVNRGDFLGDVVRTDLLDRLLTGEPGAYARLMAEWNADFTAFYASRRSSERDIAAGSLKGKLADLKLKNDQLRQRVADRDDRLARLTERLKELKEGRETRARSRKEVSRER
jgi:hypothetical protein